MSDRKVTVNEAAKHSHGRYEHNHAAALVPHDHMLRAVCHAPECDGCTTHNIHPFENGSAR